MINNNRKKKQNRADNYKHLLKDKSVFYIKLNKLKIFLKHKICFMFVPHSKKKTITISIPIYGIILFSSILSILIIYAFFMLTQNTVIASKTTILTVNYEKQLEEIKLLKETFLSVSSNDLYRVSLTNMLSKSRIKMPKDFTFDDGNIKNSLLKISNKNYELETVKNYLDELNANITAKQKTMEVIPSIFPINKEDAILSRPFQSGKYFPNGIAFETIAGTPIRATASGEVSEITYNKIDGFSIIIKHALAISTTYKGLATVNFTIGKKVTKGEIIGYTKSSIFEYKIKIASDYVDPLLFTTYNQDGN